MISKKLLNYLDENRIDELYSIKNMTIDELMKKFHISYKTIKNYFDIKHVTIKPAKRRVEIRDIPDIGRKFGQWTVISNEIKKGNEIGKGKNNRSLYIKCKCNCGNISWKSISALRNGKCFGCKKCANKTYIDENGDTIINKFFIQQYNRIINSLKIRKKLKNMKFNITPKYLEELYFKQNKKCKLSGIDLTPKKGVRWKNQNLSVDRIDSEKGYEIGNIQLVDKRINLMKGKLDNNEFIELCKLIAKNNN